VADELEPYATVRIRQLTQPLEDYDPWRVNVRPPHVGETGTLIEVLTADGLPNKYVVERCDSDGIDEWLCDFWAEEIELVEPYPA
jgi:hypothetical protein